MVTAAGFSGTGLIPAANAEIRAMSANSPKPEPRGEKPFLPPGSATSPAAPTLGVIGDSVARGYAYYLARELGPRGVRVVDAAIYGCPATAVPFIVPVRGREEVSRCPDAERARQTALVRDFHPRVVLWHSILERFDLIRGNVRTTAGTPDWERQIMAGWDDILTRVTREGARVLLVLPLWYEHQPPEPPARGAGVERLRNMYQRWAAGHRDQVTVVDVAPLVCPSGPPCGLVGGIDFRPDQVHFDDPGGTRVAAYLRTHVPALAALVRAGRRPAGA
ncbi:hypothetical protein GCM10010151_02170 [Actinoallomurus spadix]|uniref:SGNH domain-containing protein n=2 Tax=Actinoallomurus spadix TaxID=79912 RepID=A0ABN0VRT0_9ACTN